MIEINLSPNKKEASITNVGGIDLSLLNVKMLVLALILLYVPEGMLVSHYDDQIKAEQDQQTQLRNEHRKIVAKVRSMDNIKRQVDALMEQEQKLARKLEVVKEVINKRQNPYKVLKYIAENIPDGVWLTSLDLQEKELTMQGYSTNFKNIGQFLENLKNSIFFMKNLNYERPKGLADQVDGVYMEVFQIKANIASFE